MLHFTLYLTVFEFSEKNNAKISICPDASGDIANEDAIWSLPMPLHVLLHTCGQIEAMLKYWTPLPQMRVGMHLKIKKKTILKSFNYF